MAVAAEATHLRDLKFDPRNPRQHNPRNIGMIADTLQTVGPARSIVIDEHNVILAGNGVVEAAAQAGIEHVRVYDRDTGELGPPPPPGEPALLAVRVSGLTEEQKRQYAVADNRTAELAEWDVEVLTALVEEGTDLSSFWFDDELEVLLDMEGEWEHSESDEENPYTQKIDTPIYEPTMEAPPSLDQLYDTSKRDELLAEIAHADIPQEVKAFLQAAAERHVVFNYQNIAEYYAHADPLTQALMERSALVIIDFNQAIEHGYVRARDRFLQMIAEQRDA